MVFLSSVFEGEMRKKKKAFLSISFKYYDMNIRLLLQVPKMLLNVLWMCLIVICGLFRVLRKWQKEGKTEILTLWYWFMKRKNYWKLISYGKEELLVSVEKGLLLYSLWYCMWWNCNWCLFNDRILTLIVMPVLGNDLWSYVNLNLQWRLTLSWMFWVWKSLWVHEGKLIMLWI